MLSFVCNQANGYFDLDIANGQLLTGADDLPTLFMIALFSSNVESNTTDPWCGNSYQTYPTGSRIQLLFKGVKSGASNILKQAEDYATECLSSYVTLGIISNLSVVTNWYNGSGTNLLTMAISCNLPGNSASQILTYRLNTQGTAVTLI